MAKPTPRRRKGGVYRVKNYGHDKPEVFIDGSIVRIEEMRPYHLCACTLLLGSVTDEMLVLIPELKYPDRTRWIVHLASLQDLEEPYE